MSRLPFHLVELSPWPLIGSLGAMMLMVGLTSWFHNFSNLCMLLGLITIILTMYNWWRDVVREATFMGEHTSYVTMGLRLGMILFITSEILFFFAFFWAFFHSSLSPSSELGCAWPPLGILPLNPFAIPLLNTAVLLASGVTITWAHHAMLEGRIKAAILALAMTIMLGGYFTFLQAMEYYDAPFVISDSVYGSTFFVATGFHGAHVIIGSTILLICLIRMINNQYSPSHHFGFEAAAWYWHFVDVVWIFLYMSIYWWGS